MSDRRVGGIGLMIWLIAAIIYWSLQPTCGDGEVRVRGFFMTACVIGH